MLSPLQEQIYSFLHYDSKTALLKTTKKWGHPYKYKPRGDLLRNIAEKFGISEEQVYFELMEMREKLLSLM